jgi:hypothetical protein
VDSASIDASHDYLRELDSQGLATVLFLEKNVGGDAFNRVLPLTRGDLVHFSANDLEFLPGWSEHAVAAFETFDEAIALANGHGYGLSSSIYTTDPLHALRFRERVSAGMVSVNNSTSGAEAHLPFGGNGKSGNGSRQSGVWVLDQFTRWQAMNWDYSGRLQKAQMDVADVQADLGFRLP